MYELTWDQIDFTNGFDCGDDNELSNENAIKETLFPIATAILILGGMLIVAVAGVALYKIYTQDKQIQSALQMAKNDNRQIEITTDNSFSMTLNVDKKSSLSLAGESASITRITVYPKGYHNERVITPNGHILTPYSNYVEF